MNARERMMAAINHESMDRVPTDMWATGEVMAKLRDHFGEDADIREELGVDGFGGVGAAYIGPELPEMPEGETVNFWGMKSRSSEYDGGVYMEQYYHPLADAVTVDELDAYNWPSADWFDYSQMREIAVEKRKMQVLQCGYMAPFYMHNKLRGLEAC